ncbi:MAG TPA: heparinase II/III family protein, partial [Acidimicrobiales bacterium]|nr:heparinase II/III family protein [Acidimicrobiales bacterium]
MSRLRAAARDVRALGAGAPLRVAYDGSKALGGHTVVFDAALRRAPTAAVSRPVFALAAPTGPALDRARAEADVIAGGAVTLYGRELQVGDDPDWHAAHDPLAPGVRWPDGPWWQIDVRLAARVADIKWVWELGRHRHLVVLARALSGPHPEPSWAATLNAHLHSWLHHNPLEQGVHWASNLEVALRAMNWLEVIQLAGAHPDPEVRRAMDAHLAHSGTHLLLELPYTVSTMRNNHLIGDAVGLVVLAHAFPDLPPARRWARAGERLLLAQLDREVRPDGSMVEDSVSYHRFVLELLCRRALLGDAPARVLAAMLRAARFLD